jgi:hypothetical protein
MKARYGIWLLYVVGISAVGWYGYGYLCDTKVPIVDLVGLEDGAYCARELCCTVKSDKNGAVQLVLDGKEKPQYVVSKISSGVYQFTIPTQQLSDGQHSLLVKFTDGTFHKNTVVLERSFTVDNVPLSASLITGDLSNTVQQGHTVHLQMQVNKKLKSATIHALSKSYACVPESAGSHIYECFVPIACEEQPNAYLFTVDLADHVGNVVNLDKVMQVKSYPFKKQMLSIDQAKIKHEQENGNDQKEFEALIARLTGESNQDKLWRGAFCAPTEIKKITCEFGTVRTTQHKGRYAHKAVDVINYPRSVVWAPQDGRVVVKDRFAASGNTVVLDHGCGVLSLFFHLEDFADIKIGDLVAQGNPLGTEGKTGYATGYHLHWEMRVGNIPVNPLEWIEPTF